MASFFEGQTSRAERYRKQQLYKNMLDQQVHYQNVNRESQPYSNKFILNKSHISQPYNYSTSTNMPQPYKRFSYSRNSPTPKSRLLTQPEERPEKYLQSCEQIINNLKLLTQKRKQKELELLRLQSKLKPGYKSKKQEEDQVYRYLRSRNSGSTYKNNQQADKKRQKCILKPLKVTDPLSKSAYQEKGKNMKEGPSKKKLKNMSPRDIVEKSNRSLQSRKDSKSKQRQKTPQNENLNPEQKETFHTMIELMKYFKAKQQQMEKQKQQQRRKSTLVNEQVQVDPILDQQPADLDQQPADLDYQPADNQRQQSNESELKLRALMKLRQLNLKSRQLVEKLKKSKSEEKEEIILQQNKNKPKKQHRLKKRLEEEIKKKKMEQQQEKKSKEQSQNEQLLKAINNQLNKQEQQNESLADCLQAISQFLKDQNQEIQALKQSQIEAAKKQQPKKKQPPPIKSKNSLLPKFRAEQFPKIKKSPTQPTSQKKQQEKPKAQHTKQEQIKLQEAFLKKLKKLRVRSKQLNDKLSPYKKQNQSQNEQSQQSPNQMVTELSESPRDIKLIKQQN